MTLWVLGRYFGMARSEDILKKADFKMAMLLQLSRYNKNGSSSNIYEGSIEDSGMMNRQLLCLLATSNKKEPF